MNISELTYNPIEKYKKFNALYFDGELPIIPITFAKMKGKGGIAGVTVTYDRYDRSIKTIKDESMFIKLNSIYKRTAEQQDGILLHEMIHIMNYVHGEFNVNHQGTFLQKAKEISSKIGFEFPLTDDTQELSLASDVDKELYVIVAFPPNKTPQFQLMSPITYSKQEKIISIAATYITQTFPGYNIKVYKIKDPLWSKLAHMHKMVLKFTTKKFYVIKDEWLQDLLKNGTEREF